MTKQQQKIYSALMAVTSDEMLEHLKGKSPAEIVSIAFRHFVKTEQFTDSIILSFPRRVDELKQ